MGDAGADLVCEKNIVDWLEKQPAEQSEIFMFTHQGNLQGVHKSQYGSLTLGHMGVQKLFLVHTSQ